MHLIDMSNDRANMAYVGELPWHGLGENLTPGAPIETWLEEAGMAHEIKRSRVVYRFGKEKGEVGVMDDRHVLYRDDTNAPLAVVSNRFKIVQPRAVLEFFRDLVGATGDYILETAGMLNGGARYWALAKYRDALQFGQDKVSPYLLLATACDGSMNTIAQHTGIRVVCNNTLQFSLSADSVGAIKVSHRTEFKADQVKAELGVADAIANYERDIAALINLTLSRTEACDVLVELVGKRDATGALTNEKNVKRVVNEIMVNLANAPGANLDTARGTGWGVMNAVTRYVDFDARARNQNNRFNSGQFGAGAKLKRDAFAAIMAAA